VLQRLDSILLSLGMTLILAAAYLPSFHSSPSLIDSYSPAYLHSLSLSRTFAILAILHGVLNILHSPPILPRVGLPAAAYIGCIVGLAVAFAGIGIWVEIW
jgi:hypothetical protein